MTELVAASPADCIEHHVISLSDRISPLPKLRQNAASLRCLHLRPTPLSVVSGPLRLAWALRRIKPDIIHTWMYHADLLGALACPLSGRKPLIWYLQTSDLDLGMCGRTTSLVRGACRLLSGLPGAVVANSEAGLKAHQRLGYANQHMGVIPNGHDTDLFRPDPAAREQIRARLGLAPDQLLAGMVARLDPVKDYPGFLSAAAKVAAGDPRVHFLLLGRGVDCDPQLRALSSAPELAGRCHLMGHSEQVARWLAALDLHVSNSLSEGMPNIVGEAMATGVVNVVTRVGDSALLVGDTGRVVEPNDPRALARAMAEVLSLPPEQRRDMGLAARRRIIENYSLSALVENFIRVYHDVLDNCRSLRLA